MTDTDVGPQALTFAPKRITSGDYEFAIGTAGSCTLVLQTILPALLHVDDTRTVRITGGTHNPMAPPVQFLQRAYYPLLRATGVEIDIEIMRADFYPAGGGVVRAAVAPCGTLRRPTPTSSPASCRSGSRSRPAITVQFVSSRRQIESPAEIPCHASARFAIVRLPNETIHKNKQLGTSETMML